MKIVNNNAVNSSDIMTEYNEMGGVSSSFEEAKRTIQALNCVQENKKLYDVVVKMEGGSYYGNE